MDGKHVVFGKVIRGMDLVYELEKIPTEKPFDRPIVAVKITRAQGQELLDPQPIENWP